MLPIRPLFFVLFFFFEFFEGDFADLSLGEFVAEFIGGGERVDGDVALEKLADFAFDLLTGFVAWF